MAMTRARARLHLTWCQTRRIYGKTQSYAPSPFLRDIPERLASGDAPFPSRPKADPAKRPWGATAQGHRTSASFSPSPSPSFGRDSRSFSTREVPARILRPVRSGEEQPTAPPVRVPRPEWVGRIVQHPRFGKGEVLDAFSPDPDLEVVIRFADGQEKTLLARVANLEIVSG